MKKLFAISLLALYVSLTIGMNVVIHTCGGKADIMVATTTVENPCGCADEMPTDMCCTTTVTTLKLDDAQKATVTTLAQKLVVIDFLTNESGLTNRFQVSGFRFEPLIPFSPPPNKDLHIFNSVFLI